MTKFGITISLTEKSPEELIRYLERMKGLEAGSVFASLQIPGDSGEALKRTLSAIGLQIKDLGLDFVVDISPRTFQNFTLKDLKEFGITGLRIDNGMTEKEIADLSKEFQIILNASTLDDAFMEGLKENGFSQPFEAWHNYYPRKNTGLWERFFAERNDWLKNHNVKTGAFIAGDKEMRGTVFEGLPTLEKHRGASPFEAFLELKEHYQTDTILLGDFDLSEGTYFQFLSFAKDGAIPLRVENVREKAILNTIFHNRFDIARDVIRADEFRRRNKKEYLPDLCCERVPGTVTIDNRLYGRYMGELQIVLVSLAADERVNVAAQVAEKDLPLLPYIQESRHGFFFYRK